MDEALRWFNLTVSALVIVAGTTQIRRWATFRPSERLHWQSTAVLNLAALIGTAESLRAGYPGGIRMYLLAVGLTWLLGAVLYRPFITWRNRHRHGTAPGPTPEETP